MAVVRWADETWQEEVGEPAKREADPVDALLALARGHAILCRRDVARVAIALRARVQWPRSPRRTRAGRGLSGARSCAARGSITAGRRAGSIPPGAPATTVAAALVGAIEGTVIALAGRAPHDELIAERAAAGVLGLSADRSLSAAGSKFAGSAGS